MAGPGDLHLINLQAFPADAAALRANKPEPVLITRTTPPVNIIGGYEFPGAPAIDLRPFRAAPAAPAIPIGDGLEFPLFLKRIHDADRVPA